MANSKNLLIALAVLSVIMMLTLSSCSKKAVEPDATTANETAKAVEPAAASEPAKTETLAATAEPAKPTEPAAPAAVEPAKTEAASETSTEMPKTKSEDGRFKLSYEPATDKYNKEIETFFKDTHTLTTSRPVSATS